MVFIADLSEKPTGHSSDFSQFHRFYLITNSYVQDLSLIVPPCFDLLSMHHRIILNTVFSCTCLASWGLADEQTAIGNLAAVEGSVQLTDMNSIAAPGHEEDPIFVKTIVETGPGSHAKILTIDGNEIDIPENSKIRIDSYQYDEKLDRRNVYLTVENGAVRSDVHQKYEGETNHYTVRTPAAIVGVRGTDFLVTHDPINNASEVTTFRGSVNASETDAFGKIVRTLPVPAGMSVKRAVGRSMTQPARVPQEKLAQLQKSTRREISLEKRQHLQQRIHEQRRLRQSPQNPQRLQERREREQHRQEHRQRERRFRRGR